jgi:hypothetical protein
MVTVVSLRRVFPEAAAVHFGMDGAGKCGAECSVHGTKIRRPWPLSRLRYQEPIRARPMRKRE